MKRGIWVRGGICLLAAAIFLCAAGCSGKVYDPDGETLSLQEGGITEAPTGDVLEIPSGDPFADSTHILRADFLNTGKSDAILIRASSPTGSAVILMDTGEADDYPAISARLDELGIKVIDHLILTHFDNDHIGSASQILQNYTVRAVYMPDYVRDSVLYRRLMSVLELCPSVEVCRPVEEITVDLPHGSLRIQPTDLYQSGMVLGSDGDHAAEENNFSLITALTFGDIDLLLMGDAEQDRLLEFLASPMSAAAFDLIKIPHHGGYDKALSTLLRQSPSLRYSIIHTASSSDVEPNLLTAIRSTGSAPYYTYNGSISFATDGVSMVVVQE